MRNSDHRLRTICEVCRQWIRIGAQGCKKRLRHHSGRSGFYCPGSGARILWSVPRSDRDGEVKEQ